MFRRTIKKITSLNSDAESVMRLRTKIQKSKGIIKKIRIIKYGMICRRNLAFIPLEANISNDVVFPHGICGIFISGGASIGSNVTIFQNVTIGSNNLFDSKGLGAPTIGSNVIIGAGAIIIGRVNISNGARVGANTTVTIDVQENATVVSQSPRIILHDTIRNNTFIPR